MRYASLSQILGSIDDHLDECESDLEDAIDDLLGADDDD